MKRVAITGISGYIGSRLFRDVVHEPTVEVVLGIDHHEPRLLHPKLRFHKHDITEPLADLFRRYRIDTAVHLVFILQPSRDHAMVRSVDIGGTQNFLQACAAANAAHVVYLSSASAYGAHADNPVPLTEEHPLRPNLDFEYSRDKAETDALFQRYASEHPQAKVAVLRSAVVMGPNANNNISKSLFQPVVLALRGHNPPFQAVHEDDVADALLRFLREGRGGTYNLAAPDTFPYQEMGKLTGKRVLRVPEPLFRSLVRATWALRLQNDSPPSGLDFIKWPWVVSVDKLQRDLGWQPKHTSRAAVEAFVATKRTHA